MKAFCQTTLLLAVTASLGYYLAFSLSDSGGWIALICNSLLGLMTWFLACALILGDSNED